MPSGTTSFYYRTRKALMHGVAARLTEVDIVDLSNLAELAADGSGSFVGTSGLAAMVSMAGQLPWLTRTRARFELSLEAGRDPGLAAVMQQSVPVFNRLVRQALTQWQPDGGVADEVLLAEQADAVERLIEGIMLSYCRGGVTAAPSIEQIDRLIRAVIVGLGILGPSTENQDLM
jgi:hypothetical protein